MHAVDRRHPHRRFAVIVPLDLKLASGIRVESLLDAVEVAGLGRYREAIEPPGAAG